MSEKYLTINDFDVEEKKILLRVDINSPVDPNSGVFLDDSRIREHIPTFKALEDTALVILAHQSKPGKKDFTTMESHAVALSKYIPHEIEYVDSLFGSSAIEKIKKLEPGNALLLENTRFYAEEVALAGKPLEKQADSFIVSKLSPLFDLFVNDAFAAAHRSQPSLVGFSEKLPMAAGILMDREISMLTKAVDNPKRPVIVVLGGMKVDDSIGVMKNMLDNGSADKILTTGLVSNIGFLSLGHNIGNSNLEFIKKEVDDYKTLIKTFYDLIEKYGDKIKMPTDVVLNVDGRRSAVKVGSKISDIHNIFDIGLDTIVDYCNTIRKAGTVIANGPAGVFELDEFSIGTREIFSSIAESSAFSVLGGGHTAVVARNMGIEKMYDHISTGGGAAINFLAGKEMPVIKALERSRKKYENGDYN